MSGAGIRLSAVLSETWRLCDRHAALAGASTIGPFLFGMVVDLWPSPDVSAVLAFVLGLVAVYVQLLLVARSLRGLGLLPPHADPRRPTVGRYPSAVLLGIIYGLGVLAGLVLLIVPGLVLAFRWYVALPVMVAEEKRAAESLRRSWELTWGHALLLIPIGVLVVALWLAAILICIEYTRYYRIPLGLAALFNAVWAVTLVLTSLLSVALYARLAEHGHRYRESGPRRRASPPVQASGPSPAPPGCTAGLPRR